MPKYAVSQTWEKSSEFKKPFNYVIGVGPVESDEIADEHEAKGEQVVLMRRLDMGDLIKLGIAEELDFMSKALVTDEQKKPDEKAGEAVGRAILKADNYSRMEKMINLVAQAGVLAPKLLLPPTTVTRNGRTGEIESEIVNENARQKGLLYIDHLPYTDRLEMFATIFESDGLATFRGEQTDDVGNVEDVEDIPVSSDGPVDIRPSDA